MGVGIAYEGAAQNRFLQDFQDELRDANDDWWMDARTLAARSWQLFHNDPYFHALVETLVGGVIGAGGLRFRSLYQEDDGQDTTQAELDTRAAINARVRRATARTRIDANGLLSYRDAQAVLYRSCLVTGDGIAVRVWKPNRINATHGTCWRHLDSARISNPNLGANTDHMFEGFELDDDGAPIAVHAQRSHPNRTRTSPSFVWDRIPFYAPDGSLNVIHRKRIQRPEQIRGIGIATPVLLYLAMLKGTSEAWAIAKRIQASYALLIKTKNPVEAAAADRYGATLTGRSPIKPGGRYYHNHDAVEPLNWQFQGSDYENFRNPIIEAVCAVENVPYEMVLQRLTKSNLASSRAALLSYYTTCRREQDAHIEQAELPRIEAFLREDIVRGNLSVRSQDWDEITRGRWQRPPRVWPDPEKEAKAARAWEGLGRSLTGIYDEAGLDFEAEILQRKEDNAFLATQGVSIAQALGPVTGGNQQEKPPKDDEDDDEIADDDQEDDDDTADDDQESTTP